MAALFSNQGGGAVGGEGSGSSASPYLLQFRAGKMRVEGKTVVADKRKGLLYITQSEDMLMHLCWRDRGSGQVEDDLILFPDDTEFRSVGAQCPTGRVYLLRFKNQAGRKLFFWMQEPSADKDAENAAKVNELLNNPPTTRGGGGGGGGGSGHPSIDALHQMAPEEMEAMGMDGGQMMQLLQSMMTGQGGAQIDPAQLMQLAGGAIASPPAPATPANPPRPSNAVPNAPSAPAHPQHSIALADLQSILSNMNSPGTPQHPSGPGIDLEDVISRDEVRSVAEAAPESLLPHLPASTNAELSASLRSPQLRQAAGSFGLALQTGQLAPVLRQFQLPEAAVEAATRGDVEGFASSLEGGEASTGTGASSSSAAKPESESSEKKDPPATPKKEDKDADMDLD